MHKKIGKIGLFIMLYWLTGYTAFAPDAYTNPYIRVLLVNRTNQKTITLQAATPLRIWGNPIKEYARPDAKNSTEKKINLSVYGAGGLSINRKYTSENPLSLFAATPITFQGRDYSGFLQVFSEYGRIRVVNFVRLETYLEGIINAEISSQWHEEAVKAQAVVSRTFALYRKARRTAQKWDISDSERDQVYKGIGISDPASRNAVRMTSGIHLRQNNRVIESYFHSNSGGATALAENVWRRPVDYVRSITTPYGRSDPAFNWSYTVPYGLMVKVMRRAGKKLTGIYSIRVASRYASGRAKEIEVLPAQNAKPVVISAKKLRRYLGGRNIKSMLFTIRTEGTQVIFEGRGFGHGVGMCQWCAKEMAEKGQTYTDIIDYFFNGVTFRSFN